MCAGCLELYTFTYFVNTKGMRVALALDLGLQIENKKSWDPYYGRKGKSHMNEIGELSPVGPWCTLHTAYIPGWNIDAGLSELLWAIG